MIQLREANARSIISQSHRSSRLAPSRAPGRPTRSRRFPVPVPVPRRAATVCLRARHQKRGISRERYFPQKVTFARGKAYLGDLSSRASSRVVARAPLCPRCRRRGRSSTDRLRVDVARAVVRQSRARESRECRVVARDSDSDNRVESRDLISLRTFTARRRRRRSPARARVAVARVAHRVVGVHRVARARAIARASHASTHRDDECRARATRRTRRKKRSRRRDAQNAKKPCVRDRSIPYSTHRERHRDITTGDAHA